MTVKLAVKLNGGDAGILADVDSPAYVLERATAAPEGEVPLWGQTGDFVVAIGGMRVRIEMDGIFGIAAMPIPGFATHAVDYGKPFISNTGYRRFAGYQAAPALGMTVDAYVRDLIASYINDRNHGPKGKLVAIRPARTPGRMTLPSPH